MPLPTEIFTDLRVYDRSPEQIYQDAKLDLTLKLPGWVPRETSHELLLLRTLALEVSELAFVINRLPSGIMEIVLKMLGLERDSGARPSAVAKFTTVNNIGYEIPGGTLLRVELDNGLPPVMFLTANTLVIPPGATEGTVSIIGQSYTSNANGMEVGTELYLMDTIIHVASVVLDSPITGGLDPENGTQFLERGVNRLSRLSDTLVLPYHFSAFAEENAYVSKAFAIDNYDGDADIDGEGPVGDDPGHITVAVYGDNEPISSDVRDEIRSQMEQITLPNLTVHVVNPTISTQDVSVTVKKYSAFESSEVIANVTAAIEGYLDPMNWDWSNVIRVNEIIALIGAVEGVAYVDTLTTPASNVNLDGVASLVQLGELEVIVT